MISKAIELFKGTEVAGFLSRLATEGVEIPQHRHGASGLDCRLPGPMEILHREQRAVEIIHRAVNGITGAVGPLMVIYALPTSPETLARRKV